MEREASLLRCAKLSCYAEFNRMVHAIARSGGENLSGAKMVEGDSAEYFFYTTLVAMLKQVISNSNSMSQQVELQQVYQWFCGNKPLIAKKTSSKRWRPKLSLSNGASSQHGRPQTAPAALLSSPPSTPHYGHTRAHTTRPHGFTANYMSHSLALEQETHRPVSVNTTHKSAVMRRAERSGSRSSSCQSQNVSVVHMPLEDSKRQPLTTTTLLQLAPAVAATMEWKREMKQELMYKAKPSSYDLTPKELTSTVDDMTDKGWRYTEPDTSTTPAQEHNREPFLVTKPPITSYHHTTRSQPPVNVITLGLTQHHTLPTARIQRTGPTALKRTSHKVASGFNCSRYRPRTK